MQVFDASAIIDGWETYEQFPSFWRWLGQQIAEHNFAMSDVAFEETKSKLTACADWLDEHGIEKLPVPTMSLQNRSRLSHYWGSWKTSIIPKVWVKTISS
jgi:hypothetical protein